MQRVIMKSKIHGATSRVVVDFDASCHTRDVAPVISRGIAGNIREQAASA
ncbi:MAG TPA: hypothetical protein VG299_09685 [Candidatus Dormibacteraeota bacterium]|jgi:hypothetical protein|nr:hypothetical protein [Candidatus Dormibacteraeota bacterium]